MRALLVGFGLGVVAGLAAGLLGPSAFRAVCATLGDAPPPALGSEGAEVATGGGMPASGTGPEGAAFPATASAPAPAPGPAAEGDPHADGGPAVATEPDGTTPPAASPHPVKAPDGDGTPATSVVLGPARAYLLNGDGGILWEMLPSPEEVLGEALCAAARSTDLAAPERAAAIQALREKLRSEDPKEVNAAFAVLEELAAVGRLLPAEITSLEDEFRRRAADDPSRARLAALAVRAHGDGPRLADFLAALPAAEEPAVRRAVLDAVHAHPSAVGRRYLEGLIADDPDDGVLASALDDDRIATAATRVSSPGLVAALDRRLARGGLGDERRGQAYRALALAGMHAPGATTALARAAAAEPDPRLAAFVREAERAVATGEMSPGILRRLWSRQYPEEPGSRRAVSVTFSTVTSGAAVPVPVPAPEPGK